MSSTPNIIGQSKANAEDFHGRFREIVSDPLNLLVERHPLAGHLMPDGTVVLHNGIRMPLNGPNAYYGSFSAILVINRGVHEPLEEFVFQEVLRVLPQKPTMLELGAYWAHYSMWLKKCRPDAIVRMVEPDSANIQAGKANFAYNNFSGDFIHDFVGHGKFGVDAYLKMEGIKKLTILHSDIQGFEVQMLSDSVNSLSSHAIDYVFVSTHTQELHGQVVSILRQHGYRIEVSADFEFETTSYDGLVFATSPLVEPVFNDFIPMNRIDISKSKPADFVKFLHQIS